jgi:hypothetical protein
VENRKALCDSHSMHDFCSYNQSQMRIPENTQSDAITTLTHISQSQALMDNTAAARACMHGTIPSYFDKGSSTPLLLEADTS